MNRWAILGRPWAGLGPQVQPRCGVIFVVVRPTNPKLRRSDIATLCRPDGALATGRIVSIKISLLRSGLKSGRVEGHLLLHRRDEELADAKRAILGS